MKLTETTQLPDAALPLAPFRAHLRMGTGFGDDSLQDEVLLAFLRASLAAVEARTGKVLLAREFIWQTENWGTATGVNGTFARLPAGAGLGCVGAGHCCADRRGNRGGCGGLSAGGGCPCAETGGHGRGFADDPNRRRGACDADGRPVCRLGRPCPRICGRRFLCWPRIIMNTARIAGWMPGACRLGCPRC